MKKKEIIDAVASQTGVTKSDAESVIKAFRDTIVKEAAAGGQITIRGLGTFSGKDRKARTARNPATGAEVFLPDRRVLTFRSAVKLTS